MDWGIGYDWGWSSSHSPIPLFFLGSKICNCFNLLLILLLNWFRPVDIAGRMKREPGANPGQSRCCEAPREVPI